MVFVHRALCIFYLFKIVIVHSLLMMPDIKSVLEVCAKRVSRDLGGVRKLCTQLDDVKCMTERNLHKQLSTLDFVTY